MSDKTPFSVNKKSAILIGESKRRERRESTLYHISVKEEGQRGDAS